MTSKFRRNTDRALLNHINDYLDVRKDVNTVQDNTTNTGIIDIINPVSGSLNMNNQDIINCDNIDLKTINNSDYVSNPVLHTINVNGYDIKNANNIGTNNIDTKTVNGSGILLNPATADIDLNNNNLLNVNEITSITTNTQTIQNTGNPYVSFNSDVKMNTLSISDVSNIQTLYLNTDDISGISNPFVRCNTNLNMSFNNIAGCVEIDTGTLSSQSNLLVQSSGILTLSSINEEVLLDSAFNANNKTLYNIDSLSSNTANIITLQSGSINPVAVSSDLNMQSNDIYNIDTLSTNQLTSPNVLQIQATGELSLQALSSEITINSTANYNGNNINNVFNGNIQNTYTQTLQSGIIDPIVVNSGLDMKTNNILDVGTITANELKTDTLSSSTGGDISVNKTLNLNGFHNINSANVVDTYELYAGTTNTNNILSDLGEINISGDFKGDNKANIYDIKTLRAQDIFINSITKNILEENIQVNSELNMTGNDIINVGNLGVSSLNGLTPMYNASIANLDMKNYNINNVNMLNTGTLQSNVGGTPIIINETLTTKSILPGVGSYNIGSDTDPYENITANNLLTTALTAFPGYTEIIINNDLNLDNFKRIKKAFSVETKYLDARVTGTTIEVLSDLNLSSKNITNVNNLNTTTLNSKTPLYTLISSDLDFKNFNITNVNNLNTTTLNNNTPLYTLISSDLDFKNFSITNVNNLNTTTLNGQSILTPTIASSTYLTQANASSTYLTQANASSTYLTQANASTTYLTSTLSTTLNANQNIISNVQEVNNTTSSLKLKGKTGLILECTDTSILLNSNINGNNKNIVGLNNVTTTTINGFSPMYNPATSPLDLNTNSIVGVNNIAVNSISKNLSFPGTNILYNSPVDFQNNNISNIGTLGSTTINNSGNLTTDGTLRAGLVLQDTSVSCYAQYTQTISTSLAVPLTPTNLVVVFNTSLTPLNVTTSTPTFTTFTIQQAGLYRCVYSINGEMSADREMAVGFRKNGTPIRTLTLSRVGTRNVEISFNELIDFVVGDVLSISVVALDAAFTFTLRSATFNIEKIRKNTL